MSVRAGAMVITPYLPRCVSIVSLWYAGLYLNVQAVPKWGVIGGDDGVTRGDQAPEPRAEPAAAHQRRYLSSPITPDHPRPPDTLGADANSVKEDA